MKKHKVISVMKIKIDRSKLPNPWHFEQKMKGGKIHKSEKYVIPRKKKYKNKEVDYDE